MKNVSIADVLSNPLWLPIEITNNGYLVFRKLGEDSLRDSSFLDSRLKGASSEVLRVEANAAINFFRENDLPLGKLANIFHISHVGSTYVARLCDGFGKCVVYREPTVYRQLSNFYFEVRSGNAPYSHRDLEALHILLNKLFTRGSHVSVIKHTSRNLLLPIRNSKNDLNDLSIYTNLSDFLAHGLSSKGTQSDAMGVGTRIHFINSLLSDRQLSFNELNVSKKIALIWLNEMYKVIARSSHQNAMKINFDEIQRKSGNDGLVKLLSDWLGNNVSGSVENFNEEVFSKDAKSGKSFNYNDRNEKIKSNLGDERHKATMAWSLDLINKNPLLASLRPFI